MGGTETPSLFGTSLSFFFNHGAFYTGTLHPTAAKSVGVPDKSARVAPKVKPQQLTQKVSVFFFENPEKNTSTAVVGYSPPKAKRNVIENYLSQTKLLAILLFLCC